MKTVENKSHIKTFKMKFVQIALKENNSDLDRDNKLKVQEEKMSQN